MNTFCDHICIKLYFRKSSSSSIFSSHPFSSQTMPRKKRLHNPADSFPTTAQTSPPKKKQRVSPEEKHDEYGDEFDLDDTERDEFEVDFSKDDASSIVEFTQKHVDSDNPSQTTSTLRRNSSYFSDARSNLSSYTDDTPSRYSGVSRGQLGKMLNFKNFMIKDIKNCNAKLEEYAHKSAITRLLAFTKKNKIFEVYQPLWFELCNYMIRNFSNLWCFRDADGSKRPYSAMLMKAFSQRFSVCCLLFAI